MTGVIEPTGRAVLGAVLMALAPGATHLRRAARRRSESVVRFGKAFLVPNGEPSSAQTARWRDILTAASNGWGSRPIWTQCLGPLFSQTQSAGPDAQTLGPPGAQPNTRRTWSDR